MKNKNLNITYNDYRIIDNYKQTAKYYTTVDIGTYQNYFIGNVNIDEYYIGYDPDVVEPSEDRLLRERAI